jgi:hypothetical protein
VISITGVKKKSRRAHTRKRGGDFSADKARFSQPGDNDFAPTAIEQFNGLDEPIVEPIDQRNNARRFDV